MIIPEWLFQEPIEKKIKKLYNPKPLKQIAIENFKLDDKQISNQLAKEMISPNFFTDRNLDVGFNITLESHHINHANSILTFKPKYPEFRIEIPNITKIMKELSIFCASLLNQYKFKYQIVFSARFDKQDEVLDETELFNNLKINHNLTESDLDKIDVRSPLEHQIQQQEMKHSGWRFDRIIFITV